MKRLLAAVAVSAVLLGCAGEAQLEIKNNTSRYVSGAVASQTFGIVSGGSASRTIKVGGFLRSSSQVDISADIHTSWESTSAIAHRETDRLKLEADHSYTWEVYYASPTDEYLLRLESDNPHTPLLAP